MIFHFKQTYTIEMQQCIDFELGDCRGEVIKGRVVLSQKQCFADTGHSTTHLNITEYQKFTDKELM